MTLLETVNISICSYISNQSGVVAAEPLKPGNKLEGRCPPDITGLLEIYTGDGLGWQRDCLSTLKGLVKL